MRSLVKAIVILVCFQVVVPVIRAQDDEPLDLGIEEEAGIGLVLLDVPVCDEDGRAVPGLTIDDFRLELNHFRRPIYSVDDLCSMRWDETLAGESPAGLPYDETLDRIRTRRLVFYLDFSQTDLRARDVAVHAARQWVRERMEDGDRVLVVAYTTRTGLRWITDGFVGDRVTVYDALQAAYDDPTLVDEFPIRLGERRNECAADPNACDAHNLTEYFHGRRALNALQGLLQVLADEPGAKELFHFHGNQVVFPDRLYRQEGSQDHYRQMERLAGDAVAARVKIHPAFSGSTGGAGYEAVTYGLSLADFTGGQYNRAQIRLDQWLEDSLRSGCRCVYRIAFYPPTDRAKVYTALIEANGRVLPARYRVRYLNEAERWVRRAASVLDHPENHRDVGVAVDVLPQRFDGKRWTVSLELAVDVTTLGLLSGAGELRGEWEVGALLYRTEDGGGALELAGESKVRLKAGGGPGLGRAPEGHPEAIVVHRRVEQRLKPGTWRLTGFARDSTMRMFGADDRVIVLPKGREGAIVGPLVRSGPVDHVVSLFPLARKGDSVRPTRAVPESGAVPLLPVMGDPESDPAMVFHGEDVELVSWLCAEPRPARNEVVTEFTLENGGTTPVSFSRRFEKQGRCLSVSDRVATSELAPGAYVYRVTWSREGRTRFAERRLVVLPRSPGVSDSNEDRAQ